MTKLQFATEVAKIVGGEVRIVNKPNGVEKVGIVQETDDAKVLRPTVYVDDMYDCGISINEAVEEVSNIFQTRTRYLDNLTFDIMDFDQVKEHVRIRLYHQGYLPDVDVFTSAESYGFEDLILVPYVEDIQVDEPFRGSVRINRSMTHHWGVSEQDIIQIAIDNSSSDIKMRTMREIIEEISDVPFPDLSPIPDTMHVVSNETGAFGAVAIIYMIDILKERFGSFFVIPSSLHEVIVVPDKFEHPASQDLDCMVNEVNDTQLDREDILSDHIYKF